MATDLIYPLSLKDQFFLINQNHIEIHYFIPVPFYVELRAYLSYQRKKLPLTYWRSKNGHEVDFLLGTRTAIEIKASKKISKNDFKGLKYLKEEGVFENFILVSQDPISTLADGIVTIPWQKFLTDLWKDKFI